MGWNSPRLPGHCHGSNSSPIHDIWAPTAKEEPTSTDNVRELIEEADLLDNIS